MREDISSQSLAYLKFLKPILDRFIGLVLFLLFLPLFFIIYWFIKSKGYNRPFFIQKRTGRHKNIFKLYKFRTMPPEKGIATTRWGTFLRKYSLDELPQLLNIVKGDMAFIGPRPLLVEYIPFYTRKQDQRHEVKPGITGWAQINGRNQLSWQQKFDNDIWYVKHVSFMLDLKIWALTFKRFVNPKDVHEKGLPEEARFSQLVLCNSPLIKQAKIYNKG